jgi:hypothetical protein
MLGGMDTQHFPSKRDLWLALLIWAGAVGLVYAGFHVLGSTVSPMAKVSFGLVSLLALVLMLWLLYFTRYTFLDRTLVCACGPFKLRVPLDAIRGVRPSHNPVASPACSLDRLHIEYEGSRFGVLVSPKDKTGFLAALVERCPNLYFDGERVSFRDGVD